MVVVLAVGGGGEVVVLEAPAVGVVEPVLLAGGPPAWAWTSGAGTVEVVEALTPATGPIGGVVGWCADGARFVDAHLGVSFAADGSRYVGHTRGRVPADATATGLARYGVEVARGDGSRPDLVRILDRSPGRTGAVAPPTGTGAALGTPQGCRLPDRRLDGRDPSSLIGVRDHADLAGPLDAGVDGWQIADGWVRIGPDGGARWCTGSVDRDRPCPAVDGVTVDLGVSPDEAGGAITGVGDPLAVRLHAGRVVAAAVLPSSTWVGSSLRGATAHRVRLLGMDPTGSRLLVARMQDADGGGDGDNCISPAPSMSPAPAGTAAVYVDLDTRFAVGEAATADELARIGEAPAVVVDVTVDAVTCRALLITVAP